MKKHYDFSKGQRGAVLPTTGKTRVTIWLDDVVLESFKERASRAGKGYQTLINEALRAGVAEGPLNAKTVRQIMREELRVIEALKRGLAEVKKARIKKVSKDFAKYADD